MFGRRYRMRSTKNVVDELEFLHRNYYATQFTFYDDAFTVNQERTMEICDEILRRGLKIKWDCETRVDMVSKELFVKMREAGCIAVWFGVESGSKTLLTSMGKGFLAYADTAGFQVGEGSGFDDGCRRHFGVPRRNQGDRLGNDTFREGAESQ